MAGSAACPCDSCGRAAVDAASRVHVPVCARRAAATLRVRVLLQVDEVVGSEPQRLADHLWLHSLS